MTLKYLKIEADGTIFLDTPEKLFEMLMGDRNEVSKLLDKTKYVGSTVEIERLLKAVCRKHGLTMPKVHHKGGHVVE